MKKKEHLVKGLEWVEARVPNYAEMVEFYHHTLGLPVNFEEERHDFIQFRIGGSKTYLALLDAKKTGSEYIQGFIPTLEVSDLDKFVSRMKKKGMKFAKRIVGGEHVRLIDFYDTGGRLLQAFEFKNGSRNDSPRTSLSTNNTHL